MEHSESESFSKLNESRISPLGKLETRLESLNSSKYSDTKNHESIVSFPISNVSSPRDVGQIASDIVGKVPTETKSQTMLHQGEKDTSKVPVKYPLKMKTTDKNCPNSLKSRKVQRKDIRVKSPKSPAIKKLLKPRDLTKVKQRHLSVALEDKPNMVKNLVNSFEQKSIGCVNMSQNMTESVEKSISTIKKGSVMNAFEKLMSKNGVGSPSKTPQKKSVKRLKCRKITSDQKKIEDWLRK